MSDAVLRATDVTVRHGGVVALSDVTLEVPAGHVVGLIGPNGAGKTTFIDAVTGFTRLERGTVLLDGRDITRFAPQRRVRAGLARTFQSGELFDDLSVRENLELAAHVPSWRSTVGDLFGVRPGRSEVDPVLERLGIADLADRLPSDLSHGQRQLVALGRALASRPKVVVLDEPAAGLDSDETAALAEVIRALPASGTSVLLVDHDMSLVMGVCDRVEVVDFGRLIASGTPAEVRADQRVLGAYLGGAS